MSQINKAAEDIRTYMCKRNRLVSLCFSLTLSTREGNPSPQNPAKTSDQTMSPGAPCA